MDPRPYTEKLSFAGFRVMKTFLIFPQHLYEDGIQETLMQYDQVLLVEEPIFFYDRKWRPFRTNKVKLAYMRASMRYYHDFLLSRGVQNVRYVPYASFDGVEGGGLPKECTCYEPYDRRLLEKYRALCISLHVLPDTFSFMATRADLDEYHHGTGKGRNTNAHFYTHFKKKWDILQGVPSQDKFNRRKLTGAALKSVPQAPIYTSPYYDEAIEYVDTHPIFKKHIGNTKCVCLYPCTHQLADRQLKHFVHHKLEAFGPFQDAIARESDVLYHSGLSAAMNVGLLSPHKVIQSCLAVSKVPINSLEGFVRQVIGWRERCRYLYEYHYEALVTANHFGNSRNLRWDTWYNCATGIDVLDAEIGKAQRTAYAHHIVRLMVFLNVMVLCRVRQQDVIRWFMETCAVDAWDWVMVTNIGAMGYYSNAFMTKPYISSSNYILKMSDYPKGPWTKKWDALFYAFLKDNKAALKGGAAVYLRNLAAFERRPLREQKETCKVAWEIIKHLTNDS